jgi:autotransporter-associated beta strand protein
MNRKFLAAWLAGVCAVSGQQTYYTDGTTNAGFGGNASFLWETSIPFWTDSSGTAAKIPWANASPANNAVLGAGSGTNSYTTSLFTNITVGTVAVANGTWTIDIGSHTLTFDSASNSTLPTLISGTGGVVKNGTGSLNFGATVNYSGGTTLNGGALSLSTSGNTVGSVTVNSSSILQASATNALVGSTSLTLAGGAFQIAGGAFSQNFSTALKLTSSSTIDFGNGLGAASIVFGDSSGQTWTGNLTVSNFDVATDTLRFGTSSSGVSGGQLGAINFDGIAAQIDANGFVTPVPEAALYGLLAGLSVAGFTVHRRRKLTVEAASGSAG